MAAGQAQGRGGVRQHKSMFEKRQNQLLGVQEPEPTGGMPGFHTKEEIFKRKENELYSQGLSIQLQKEEEKHKRRREEQNN